MALCEAGHQVSLLARDTDSPRVQVITERCGAQARAGDILDPASLLKACDGMDAVLHLVGIISETGSQTFERVHTEGTGNALTAARHVGVKRFVHMSALGTRPNAVARYHKSKWAAEELVRQSGLNWTIFRPSIIYGAGDGFVNLFAKMARCSPVVPIIGDGRSQFQPIAVENVAKAFVQALTNSAAEKRTFDLAGPEIFTMNQIVDQILDVTGQTRLKMHLPIWIARIQAALMELAFNKVLGKASPLSRDQILMLQEDNVGEGKAADGLFALRHETFRTGIERYLGIKKIR